MSNYICSSTSCPSFGALGTLASLHQNLQMQRISPGNDNRRSKSDMHSNRYTFTVIAVEGIGEVESNRETLAFNGEEIECRERIAWCRGALWRRSRAAKDEREKEREGGGRESNGVVVRGTDTSTSGLNRFQPLD